MNSRHSRTIASVQAPIIPVVAEWTRNTPGTLSLGQGMVFYPPPENALVAFVILVNTPKSINMVRL